MKDYNRLHGKRRHQEMPYDCGTSLAKYLLCLFNFVFFGFGTVVLGIGIWIASDKHSFIQFTKLIDNEELRIQFQQITQPTVIEQAAYILIAAGAFMFLVSFLGYCGALRESRCLLTCYGVFLLIILLMEITAGGLAAAYRSEAEKETRVFLKSTISKYYAAKEKDAVTLMWDYIMANMKCCGVDSYEDFSESKKWIEGGKKVPDACCVLEGDVAKFKPMSEMCPDVPTDINSYWKKGCYDTFVQLIMENINIAIGIGIGIGLVQLLGIILAFCLCRSINGYIK
ncbi:CD82 antigen-like isoform X2 [Zootermopsis nevadensis]|nr:CD82 antigen-like isoform X2 [Zootermopsis nevadensis]XP_021937298.1 CD82 antigen-like isoform X2 [Zootermopsis nevadensis]